MTNTTRTLERLEQQAQQRQAQQPVQLPLWSDSKRAAPSAAFRSALFPALGRVKRQWLKQSEIFSVSGITVRFTGEQFDQSDLSVFLEITHAMQEQSVATFTAHAMLAALGRETVGKRDYVWLDSVIVRLTVGMVEITTPERRYRGHLVESSSEELNSKAYHLHLNSDFVRLFRSGYSTLDIKQRRTLTTPSAQGLHAYLATHKRPGFHLYSTLAAIVGLTDTNPRRQRQRLRDALDQLQAVGFLRSWEDCDDGVNVTKA
jgi:hypothetical protein